MIKFSILRYKCGLCGEYLPSIFVIRFKKIWSGLSHLAKSKINDLILKRGLLSLVLLISEGMMVPPY
jgi:hypothetical protein